MWSKHLQFPTNGLDLLSFCKKSVSGRRTTRNWLFNVNPEQKVPCVTQLTSKKYWCWWIKSILFLCKQNHKLKVVNQRYFGPLVEPNPGPLPYTPTPQKSGGAWVAHFLVWAPSASIGDEHFRFSPHRLLVDGDVCNASAPEIGVNWTSFSGHGPLPYTVTIGNMETHCWHM